MPSQQNRVLVCLALLFSSVAGFADHGMRFKHLTVEDGLSQGSVNAIIQDAHGFMWFGTQQGLNRYDGVEIRTYFHDPESPQSLPGDWIWDLHLDSRGILWVALNTGGIAQYDAINDQFFSPDVPAQTIKDIVEDQGGVLWLAAAQQGLLRFDPTTHATQQIELATIHPQATAITRLHYDHFGTLWVGTKDAGLLRYNPIDATFLPVDNLAGQTITHLHGANGKRPLWVATEEHGIVELDPATSSVVKRHTKSSKTGLSSDRVRVMYTDTSDRLWLGHDFNGANVREGQAFTAVSHHYSPSTALVDNHVRAIYEDRDNLIWFGTQRGLSIWNPRSTTFSNFTRIDNDIDHGLSENWIAAFAEHSAEQIWVATYGGGLNLVNHVSRQIEVFRHDPESANSLSDDRVMTLAKEPDGALWLGTRANGVDRFDPATGEWRNYRHQPGVANSLSHNAIPSILLNDTHLWIATLGKGLNRMDTVTREITAYRHNPANNASLCSDRILNLFKDRNGSLWIATQNAGICRFDTATGTFENFAHDSADPHSLSSNVAWLITEDIHGNLWIGTENAGVNVWKATDRQAGNAVFHRLNAKDGLMSNVVYGMLSDNFGRMWIGSNRGLTRYEPDTTKAGIVLRHRRHFTVDDGLPGNEFNFAAAMHNSSGHMLFGGTSGLTMFQPTRTEHKIKPPRLALTRFYRLNQPQRYALNNPAFEIEYSDKIVRFEYAALTFAAPGKIEYQHILQGFDQDWVDDGNSSRSTYTNLQPGEYVFKVRAAVAGDVWSESQLVVPLTVARPFWTTYYAYAAYGTLILLFVLFTYRSLERRARAAREIALANTALRAEVAVRQAKERALALQQKRTQQYLDVVEVLIVALDENGCISMINHKGALMLGYAEEDLRGRKLVDEFVHPDDQQAVRHTLDNVELYSYSESRLVSRRGDTRLIAWHNIRLPASEDSCQTFLLSGSDVTQMRKLETQLREGQKMEALGTLARGVAHDFNNVLSAILGYSELARHQLTDAHLAGPYLHKLEGSVERAKDIVQNILTFGHANQLPMELVNLSTNVADALQLVRPIVPGNVQLVEHIDADCGPVLANPGQITQIVLNLSTNACQSMAEQGGQLTVSLQHRMLDEHMARLAGALQPGRHALLIVQDTGPGMDDYTLSRMFEPFFTTRDPGEGSGLGLAVVHSVVTRMGGLIDVSSTPGAGTRFEVTFPCTSDELEPVAIPDAREAQPGRGRILFVDDSPEVAEIAQMNLTALGYEMVLCANGEDALRLLQQADAEFDILVTDQSMPGMRGEEIAERAKLDQPQLPILLISGADRPASTSIDGFLEKPFTQQALANSVRELLGESVN